PETGAALEEGARRRRGSKRASCALLRRRLGRTDRGGCASDAPAVLSHPALWRRRTGSRLRTGAGNHRFFREGGGRPVRLYKEESESREAGSSRSSAAKVYSLEGRRARAVRRESVDAGRLERGPNDKVPGGGDHEQRSRREDRRRLCYCEPDCRAVSSG